MASKCETFDHPADVGLEATADTPEELFSALAEAAAGIIVSGRTVTAAGRRALHVDGDDMEDLVVDFLNVIVELIQGERFAVKHVKVSQVVEGEVRAEAVGEPLDTDRHEMLTEVKAATYHELEVNKSPDGKWSARVILDI